MGTNSPAEDESPYERAAKMAVDSHPLPGEDLDTTYPEDAEHWQNVYTELLEFKHALIAEMDSRLPSMSHEAADEVLRSDHLVLKAEAQRFERRLTLWRERAEQLRGAKETERAGAVDQARR